MAISVENVIIPFEDFVQPFDVTIDGKHITFSNSRIQDANQPPSLLLHSLCHPHIHLDKPYLLTCNHGFQRQSEEDTLPEYDDLIPSSGTFQEALANTAKAKERYTLDDLLLRGSQLLLTAAQQGVTHVRAFVEVDHVTRFKCLEAAAQLKRQFEGVVYVQICAFAQDPVFSGDAGDENRKVIEEVFETELNGVVDVVGSTPYVEDSFEKGLENVEWAIKFAIKRKIHLDFHLDYNINEEMRPMIWDVIRLLKEHDWVSRNPGKTVVTGHCTRMTLFSDEEMQRIAKEIREANLPVSFCGLPTSDLFMMGRQESGWGGSRPRGTLQVLEMIKKFDLNACIGVNNLGNAFTPWGTGDPLALASLGIGIYQAGTEEDAKLLFDCVSSRARQAIGLEDVNDDHPGFILVQNLPSIEYAGIVVPARQRLSIKDVVWDPPEPQHRKVLRRNDQEE